MGRCWRTVQAVRVVLLTFSVAEPAAGSCCRREERGHDLGLDVARALDAALVR